MMVTLKNIAKRTPFYRLLQTIRSSNERQKYISDLQNWSDEDETLKTFYQQFIKPGDVVFDVGANLGNRAKVFLALGAKTIGFEPQPFCQSILRDGIVDQPDFHLECCALGTEPGSAEMYVSNAHTISSMSRSWIRDVQASGRFSEYQWNETIQVPVRTLDQMIDQYGTPSFVKVDVEGFELAVVSGLSKPIGAISLEFVPEHLENTLGCLDRLAAIGPMEFRYSLWNNMQWAMDQWVDVASIKSMLQEVPSDQWGDVFGRSVGAAIDPAR